MSRRLLLPHSGADEVAVGWDEPLGHFFLQAIRFDDENGDQFLIDKEYNDDQFWTMIADAAKFGYVTHALPLQLRQDKEGKNMQLWREKQRTRGKV
jgi:hypothetical protein